MRWTEYAKHNDVTPQLFREWLTVQGYRAVIDIRPGHHVFIGLYIDNSSLSRYSGAEICDLHRLVEAGSVREPTLDAAMAKAVIGFTHP